MQTIISKYEPKLFYDFFKERFVDEKIYTDNQIIELHAFIVRYLYGNYVPINEEEWKSPKIEKLGFTLGMSNRYNQLLFDEAMFYLNNKTNLVTYIDGEAIKLINELMFDTNLFDDAFIADFAPRFAYAGIFIQKDYSLNKFNTLSTLDYFMGYLLNKEKKQEVDIVFQYNICSINIL